MECADDVSAVKSSTQQLMPDGIATKRRAPLSRAETMSAVMRGFRTAVIRAVASAACRPHPPAASPACATHRSALAVSSATASFSPLLPGSHATQMLARRACSSRAVVLDKLFMDKPRSLEVLSDSVSGEHAKEPGFLLKMALKMGGFYSKESVTQRAADRLYASVTAQAEDSALIESLGVEPTFRGTHAMIVLHVWMVLLRLRKEGEAGKGVSQAMYDTFQDDVEYRVHAEGVKFRVNKWLNELEQGFYGSALAYDRALTGGAGDFAKVLHRNVFHGEGDTERSKLLERYVRREIGCLSMTGRAALLEGRIKFSGIEEKP